MSTTQEAPSRELLEQIARIEQRLGLVPEPRDSAKQRLERVELLLKVAEELGV